MKNLFRSVPQSLLVLLFIYASLSKLLAFDDFRGQLLNQTFPHWLAVQLLYALPATELVVVCCLLFPAWTKAGLYLSMLLLSAFTGYVGLVLLHAWRRVPCSCGGILSHMGWQAHFVFNLFFLAVNVGALVIHRSEMKETASVSGRHAL